MKVDRLLKKWRKREREKKNMIHHQKKLNARVFHEVFFSWEGNNPFSSCLYEWDVATHFQIATCLMPVDASG
jgi:hypothetical protein